MASKESPTISTGKSAKSRLVGAQVFAFVIMAIIIQAALGFSDAQKALAFYGVYHREPHNQIIHFFGVPGILWSLMMVFVHLPIPLLSQQVDPYLPKDYPLTYGTFLGLCYLAFYLRIDSFGGSLYAPILFLMYISSVQLRFRDQAQAAAKRRARAGIPKDQPVVVPWAGTGRLLNWALFLHILSWYTQIHWGHKIYEGAQPAVFESLGGALTVAPLFAFYEGLWFAGINKDLQKETQELVEKYTIDLCTKGVDMRVCQTLEL